MEKLSTHILTFFFLIIISLFTIFPLTNSHLSPIFYSKTCPKFHKIIKKITTLKQFNSPTTAGAALRLFFHDCFTTGCDASILISSTPFNSAERDAVINRALQPSAFHVISAIKSAMEIACPGVVSCADIIAAATRNLVAAVGGPHYPLLYGRKDGFVSKSSFAFPNTIPLPNMTLTQILAIFSSHNFSPREMVALTGAHTIGFSHCSEFASSIFNYNQSEPGLNPKFARVLKKACFGYKTRPELSVSNDIKTPNKFDNVYFHNLRKGFGVLGSDRAMEVDPRTRPFVELYGRDEKVFFNDFGKAMQKLSLIGVKFGNHGEIRRRCDAFNHKSMNDN